MKKTPTTKTKAKRGESYWRMRFAIRRLQDDYLHRMSVPVDVAMYSDDDGRMDTTTMPTVVVAR